MSDLAERAITLKNSIMSVKDRIDDLSWSFDRTSDLKEKKVLYDDRRKAVDKLRYLYEELTTIEVQLHRLG